MSTAHLMRMSWRNLWRHPRRTALTALAFAIGVFVLIVSLGLGDGMHEKMIETGVRLGSGHVVVEPADAEPRPRDHVHLLDPRPARNGTSEPTDPAGRRCDRQRPMSGDWRCSPPSPSS